MCSRNPNPRVLEHDRPLHDHNASRFIAKQYSSVTFVSWVFHFHQDKFGALFKNVITSSFLLLPKYYSVPKSLKPRREQFICLGILKATQTYIVQLRFTFRNMHIFQCFQKIQNTNFQTKANFFIIYHSIWPVDMLGEFSANFFPIKIKL